MVSKYKPLHFLLQVTVWFWRINGEATSCREEIDQLVVTKDGITYWSNDLEHGFKQTYERISGLFRMDLNNQFVKELRAGCGRMENRFGLLSDGSEICIRYRRNLEQIQGEIYSYHLAKLLGIRNVLEPQLVLINETNSFWRRINIADNAWENMRLITVTKFVKEALPVRLPDVILRRNFRVDLNSSFCGLKNETNFGIMMFLLQWSDLVIFDYLIGNFDRVVSNMFNMQWHSSSLMDPIENLVQVKDGGILLFIDNEEGFSHGYRLLDHYGKFNIKLIRNMCIFRRDTLKKLESVSRLSAEELHEQLWYSIVGSSNKSPILDYFVRMSESNINILKRRIDLVHKFVRACSQRSGV